MNIANKTTCRLKFGRQEKALWLMAKAYPNIVCVFATVSISKLRVPSWR